MNNEIVQVGTLRRLPLGDKKLTKALAMPQDLIAVIDELAALYDVSFSKTACFLMHEGLLALREGGASDDAKE